MKPTILCIEDHPDNLTLIRRIFRSERYNLLEANNGRQGISLAESNDTDLVLLDINLPDIDGYEVASRLRTSAKTALAQIPIIAVTANAMKGDHQKALEVGCTKYLAKPINIQELMDTVDDLIGAA
ncbi:MAG: response regulator [Anaerolineales bacterium]|nr:response regulator [Anaerolineales bacterium]